jgi:hypothetical protein
MFICLHRYDQQIEIPQWNKRPYTVHENILTILVQYFQHTVQAHTNQPLCVPSGTHHTDITPNDAAHQLLPYLKLHLRRINHIIWNKNVLSVPQIQLGNTH